ncbi:MAG TPA: heme ABC exporter ATP-binding protein CcmA [Gammaproteobacteria bacterium]|nr:heme ABC exporter ATP-binding protein CcmA [Gammaproteobacteria bacterium]
MTSYGLALLDHSPHTEKTHDASSSDVGALVQIVDLSCQRDHRDLFEPLNLAVLGGACIELMGPNGSGKSTLLRTLAGLHSQYRGTVMSVASVYQGHRLGLDELLSPLENLAWFAGLQDQRLDRVQALEVLARLGLLSEAHTACYRLSAGQQRRVAIARWLLAPHALWLLDEPFNALDVQSQALLNQLISEHCRGGGAVVCATHLMLQTDDKITVNLEPCDETMR